MTNCLMIHHKIRTDKQINMEKQILNWNCNGLYAHYEDLKLLISQYKPLLISLQETHLKKQQNLQLKNYSIIRKDLENTHWAHGGVLLGIHSQIHYENIYLKSNLQAI